MHSFYMSLLSYYPFVENKKELRWEYTLGRFIYRCRLNVHFKEHLWRKRHVLMYRAIAYVYVLYIFSMPF
jgi:hypothetical protein